MALIRDRSEGVAWQRRYEPGSPGVGEPAPDFELRDVDGERAVRLSAIVGERPVALVFGSFT